MTTQSLRSARLLPALALGLWVAGAAGPAHADPLAFETTGPVPLLAPTYGLEWSQVVEVRDEALRPRRVEIREGQKVAWQSASTMPVRISFARDVARSMHCTELVNFSLDEERLRSQLLHAGDVASLCELAPGTYRYRVERDRHSVRRLPLSQRLWGEIVVYPRSAESSPAAAVGSLN